jgi:DNA-binding transcriptional regulator LsrR (DeoR family)
VASDPQMSVNASKTALPPVRDGALMLTAAYLYYVDELSQDEVARQIGVSRSTVSRLLAEARRTGVVRIEVAAPPPGKALEREVAAELGLERVYVAPGIADSNDPGQVVAQAVGQALLESHVEAGQALLVSWGRATWSISQAPLPRLPGVEVVPAVGGLPDDEPWFQTNETARRIAATIGGRIRLLHAPAFPSPELRASLLADASIRSAVACWDSAAALLVGIGAWPKSEPAPPASFALDDHVLRRAVGDVAGRAFDANGRMLRYDAESGLLAVTRKQMNRIPRRIAVAVGVRKVDAIAAAARSGLINLLVTDVVTASALASRAASSRGTGG